MERGELGQHPHPETENQNKEKVDENINSLSNIEILKTFGIGRTDFHWLYIPNGPPFCKKEKLTDEMILKHMKGEIVLGCSPFINSTYVSFGAIDVDAHLDDLTEEQKQKIILEANEDAMKLYNYLKENNYPVYMNKSGGSVGTHIRAYGKNILAKDMRTFLAKVQIEVFGKIKHGEIFPKQIDLRETPKHIGNQIKLFCGVHPKTGDRTDLIINNEQVDLNQSIEHLKNILQNYESYKKIEVNEEDYKLIEKKGFEVNNLSTEIPEYCAFIEDVASKKILTSGEVTRHIYLDPNVDCYTRGKSEKSIVRENYIKIQKRTEGSLCNWKNDFSCGKIIKFLVNRKNEDPNAKEGLEKCIHCQKFKDYQKYVIYKLIEDLKHE
jgi:hypothetical protein